MLRTPVEDVGGAVIGGVLPIVALYLKYH